MKKRFIHLLTLLLVTSSLSLSAQGLVGTEDDVFFFKVLSPESIRAEYGPDEWGGQSSNSGTAPWGADVTQVMTGELVWAYDDTGNDSLCCEPITTQDLTGKFALIRRGTCNFSLKVYHAKQAGATAVIICNHYANATEDASTLFGMTGGDSIAVANIPAIFISREQTENIQTALDAGQEVTVQFYPPKAYGEQSAYSYQTPLSQNIRLAEINSNFVNRVTSEQTFEVKAVLREPDGNTITDQQTITFPAGKDSTIFFFQEDGGFLPTKKGLHEVWFTTSQSTDPADSLYQKFEMTDYTYGLDNNELSEGIEPSAATYLTNYNLQYGMGSTYKTGDGGTTTTMSFALANPDSFAVGSVFQITLYNMDPDGNGIIETAAGVQTSMDAYSGIEVLDYAITGTEEPNEPIFVDWETPQDLLGNGFYMVAVRFDGLPYDNFVPPSYTFGGTYDAPGIDAWVFTNDSIYSGGWSGNYQPAIRMYLSGFLNAVDNHTKLSENTMKLFPSPAVSTINVNVNLEQKSKSVQMGITDLNGRIISVQEFENTQNFDTNFNINDLPPNVERHMMVRQRRVGNE